MLPINYWSWQNGACRTTKCLLKVGIDNSVNRSLQRYQNLVNFKSWHSCSCQSYLKPGRLYASHQLSKSTNAALRAPKALSTLRANILIALELPNTWNTLCFPSTIEVEKTKLSELTNFCQQWELTFLSIAAFRTTRIMLEIMLLFNY